MYSLRRCSGVMFKMALDDNAITDKHTGRIIRNLSGCTLKVAGTSSVYPGLSPSKMRRVVISVNVEGSNSGGFRAFRFSREIFSAPENSFFKVLLAQHIDNAV